MLTPERPLVAVLDIGKTNAKVVVADPETGRELSSAVRPNAPLPDAPYRAIDADAIEAFVLAALAAAPDRARIGAIVPVAHGACAALADETHLVLPVMDYEEPALETVADAYRAERDPFALTGSPFVPLGLNLGRQLYFLETRFPQAFQTATRLLFWPQYWSWRLTGVATTEVTSAGCHTDLWSPAAAGFSPLAERRGWARLAPPLVGAGDVVGKISPAVAAATGLSPSVSVLSGIHDSNASFLRHRLARPAGDPFVVVSSGTWIILLASGIPSHGLDEAHDCLVNVDALGEPTPTARFMGGREYAAIAGDGAPNPTADDLDAVFAAGAMALPAFVATGGPFTGRTGEIRDAEGLSASGRAALASLYCALVTDVSLDLLGARGPVVIEGPFAENPLYPGLLAALREDPVMVSGDRAGTIGGALALAAPGRTPAPQLTPAVPIAPARLADYRRRWRAAVA
ncbi:FGGY-family carbohydrate kinase [Segnochrobactrum spirostomi]|uniref:FGGY-family carbohydrate kinase n=1 Tax=Segnochrobactrum spirostomi TaxID=2608987 RepID=UPI00129654DF|nr:FGGY family carbohydrate kinase [Segnochrobactrum spirostomi]